MRAPYFTLWHLGKLLCQRDAWAKGLRAICDRAGELKKRIRKAVFRQCTIATLSLTWDLRRGHQRNGHKLHQKRKAPGWMQIWGPLGSVC